MDERHSSVVISTSTLRDRVLSSGVGIFDIKTWFSILLTVSVPSHLIGDKKEPLRTTCTLAVTTQHIKVGLAIMFLK